MLMLGVADLIFALVLCGLAWSPGIRAALLQILWSSPEPSNITFERGLMQNENVAFVVAGARLQKLQHGKVHGKLISRLR
jgi:hypothetical protein